MNDGLLTALLLSLRVATAATLLAIPLGLLSAWRLGVGKPFPGRLFVETLLTLPLVLPPTVVGYALLLILGRGTGFGRWLQDSAGIHLIFTWQGASIAAAVMALPLFTRTAAAAFAAIDTDLIDAARTLGASEGRILVSVLIPLAYRGLLAGLTLAFARALGEFGATLMVAGSIPGETQTLPLALYSATQSGDDGAALRIALLLTVIAAILLGTVGQYGQRIARGRGEKI